MQPPTPHRIPYTPIQQNPWPMWFYRTQGGGGGAVRYCVLAEDASSSPVWAFRGTMADDGSVSAIEPAELFELYFHSELLSSPKVARAGYKCMYAIDDKGRDSFIGNPCINSCQGIGSLNATLPNGNVDAEYLDATIDGDAIEPTDPPPGNGITVEGLPDGLTYDNETGDVTGTPTTEGTYLVTVMGTDTSGCALTDIVSVTIGPALEEEEGGGPDPEPPIP